MNPRILATLLLYGFAALPARAQGCRAPAPVQIPNSDDAFHFDACTNLSYTSYPPAMGRHYSVWAKYRTYAKPVPWGFWLHSLEHGAVIFLYRCQNGCPGEVAALQAIADAFPDDSLCTRLGLDVRTRIIIAPDTLLDVSFLAAAWGWTLKSDCLDTAAFRAFLTAHYAQSFENFCSGGEDRSATGWCSGSSAGPRDVGSRSMESRAVEWVGDGSRLRWNTAMSVRGRLVLEITGPDGRVLGSYQRTSQTGPVEWDLAPFLLTHPAPSHAAWRILEETPDRTRKPLQAGSLP